MAIVRQETTRVVACDGPDCQHGYSATINDPSETSDREEGWIRVFGPDRPGIKDFCSKLCLASWAQA